MIFHSGALNSFNVLFRILGTRGRRCLQFALYVSPSTFRSFLSPRWRACKRSITALLLSLFSSSFYLAIWHFSMQYVYKLSWSPDNKTSAINGFDCRCGLSSLHFPRVDNRLTVCSTVWMLFYTEPVIQRLQLLSHISSWPISVQRLKGEDHGPRSSYLSLYMSCCSSRSSNGCLWYICSSIDKSIPRCCRAWFWSSSR
jgi:hypothetical protein